MRAMSRASWLVVPTLLVVALALQAHAASSQSFTATATISPVGAPERSWVDEAGVMHTRGQLFTGAASGGISGVATILDNTNVNASGYGDDFGSFTIAQFNSAWEGRYSGMFTAGSLEGTFVGHGTGAYEGMKIMGTYRATGPGTFSLEGVILDPHG